VQKKTVMYLESTKRRSKFIDLTASVLRESDDGQIKKVTFCPYWRNWHRKKSAL